MPKSWMLIALLFLLLLSLAPASSVQDQTSSEGSYQDDGSSISWDIIEPKNQTYTTRTLNLYVIAETYLATLTNVAYSIDNQTLSTLPMKQQKTVNNSLTQSCNGFIPLPALGNGVHKIAVYIDGLAGSPLTTIRTHKTEVYFEINTPADDIPTRGKGATIYFPCNRTYAPIEPLRIDASLDIRYGPHDVYSANYTLDDGIPQILPKESMNPQFWSVTYGAVYVSTELPKLPLGPHKLTIYISVNYTNAKTPWFVSGEKTVYFTVSAIGTDDAAITGGTVYIYSPLNKSYSEKSIIPIEASASTISVKSLTYNATYYVDGKGPYKLQTNHFLNYQYDLFFGSVSGTS